ncbi:MAG: hypothetical protein LBG72_06815 [Spirochaetaceae bacterium]|jgi:hypothetical protein|nr:hypothetical protein [Spirochaetaceae bacterium]
MTNSSIEKALKETWEKKEKFYEETKKLSIMEILEKIEGKKFIQARRNAGGEIGKSI